MKRIAFITIVAIIVASCASILSGTRAKVSVTCPNASSANITVDGETYYNKAFPAEIKVKRGTKPSTIYAETYDKEGTQIVEKSFNAATLGNILLGGIIGIVIDYADGAITKPKQKSYSIYLSDKEVPGYKYPSSIVPNAAPVVASIPEAPIQNPVKNLQETVTRDNPGQTSLEKTIIRWFFDSEPRGARVFWRIVSSIPDEVKNTNELYLGTTPFEETRSFNILGLTYENSNNVQIEVKLTKPGYIDQVKRFNVRQAIDQQEISAFFDLVIK